MVIATLQNVNEERKCFRLVGGVLIICKMWLLNILFIAALLVKKSASNSLCSSTKLDNTCICNRITSSEGNFVVSRADCTSIDLKLFPNQQQLPNDLILLDLSYNQIDKLIQIDYQNSILEILNLSHNEIEEIPESFFGNFQFLRKLILSHNKINGLKKDLKFENVKNLEVLDVSYNNILHITENIFLPLTELQNFDISYNPDVIGISLNSSLEKFGINKGLTHLSMENMGITGFPGNFFENYENLNYLSLADNRIEIIPSVPYTVEYLDLSGNYIEDIQAKYLNYHALKILKLNRLKRLQTIPKYAFYNLQSLQELSITDCYKLQTFSELAFGALSKDTKIALSKLNLARNSLKSLNSTYKFLFQNLEVIDLRDNQWKCNCDILWLQEVGNLLQPEKIQCRTPLILYGKPVEKLVHTEMMSCYPEKYGKTTHRILISVLILAVFVLSLLIGYLIYYGPTLHGQRVVGPDSPYSAVSTSTNL